MTQQSGVVSVAIPGVTSDTLTPGGEIIAGALIAGDPAAASVPSFHQFNGSASFTETPGNMVDGDQPLSVNQGASLTQDHGAEALSIYRHGALNGHQYLFPAFHVNDVSGTTAPVASFDSSGTTQFRVDGDGVRVHGKLKTGAGTAHTLGAYSGNAVPIYDEAGTLLGYMPLYA